jgi:hypothetical protein
MIFSAPRYIVVDDKIQHLRAITQTFESLGSACLGVRYDPASELKKEYFRGVRCLFMDLHLLEGQAGTDNRRHYALIASILEENISSSGGPFILVVWTEHAQYCDELRVYLDTSIGSDSSHARPLAVLGMPKDRFINTSNGDVLKLSDLQNAIQAALSSNPQLSALLDWEHDVLAATGDTLASLINLIPADQRRSPTFSTSLDRILSLLTREAVGWPHVQADPRAAVSAAIAPILIDRILNRDVDASKREKWDKAVTRSADKSLEKLPALEAGGINRALHLALPRSENLRPTDWGAVVEWPSDWGEDKLKSLFGVDRKQMVCTEFKLRSSEIEKVYPVLIRVGAACDYAQSNSGPLQFLFGLVIPEGAARQVGKDDVLLPMSPAIWSSPLFALPDSTAAFRLYAHIRFPTAHLGETCGKWTVRFRLREQLLMQLINAASTHAARPGIVELRAV